MDEGLDTGDVYSMETFDIDQKINAGELHDKQAKIGSRMVLNVINQLQNNIARTTAQSKDGVTYAAKINKDDCKLDFSNSAFEIHNKIRALSPKPGAYFELNNERIKILESELR